MLCRNHPHASRKHGGHGHPSSLGPVATRRCRRHPGLLLSGRPVEIEGTIQGGGVLISALKGPGTLLALLICLIGGLTLLNVGLRNVGKSIYYAVIDRMRKPKVSRLIRP